MKRLAIATICARYATGFASVRHAPAQQHDKTATSYAAKIKALQEERIAILSRAVKIVTAQYMAGTADFKELAAAEMELVNAQLDCSDTPEERIAYLEAGSKMAKSAVEIAEVRFKGRTISDLDVNWFKAVYLDMQIKLLKERQKLASSKAR